MKEKIAHHRDTEEEEKEEKKKELKENLARSCLSLAKVDSKIFQITELLRKVAIRPANHERGLTGSLPMI